MSFSDDEASAWKALTDDDLLGGRSSSLHGDKMLRSLVSSDLVYDLHIVANVLTLVTCLMYINEAGAMESTRGRRCRHQTAPDLIGDLLLVVLVLVPPVEERDDHQHGADDHGQDAGGDGAGDQTHTLRLGCNTHTHNTHRLSLWSGEDQSASSMSDMERGGGIFSRSP